MRITIYSPYAHLGPNVTVQINQMRVTWRVHHAPLLFPKTCRGFINLSNCSSPHIFAISYSCTPSADQLECRILNIDDSAE